MSFVLVSICFAASTYAIPPALLLRCPFTLTKSLFPFPFSFSLSPKKPTNQLSSPSRFFTKAAVCGREGGQSLVMRTSQASPGPEPWITGQDPSKRCDCSGDRLEQLLSVTPSPGMAPGGVPILERVHQIVRSRIQNPTATILCFGVYLPSNSMK